MIDTIKNVTEPAGTPRIAAKQETRHRITYTDPSAGKGCGPVCCLWFSESRVVHWLSYGDPKRSIRTYSPGRVDGRFLGMAPRFCDDVAALLAHCGEGKGYFVVPVSVAKQLANPDQVFATPDEYPDYYI